MPLLDLELAKRIADAIAALLARWAPDAPHDVKPWGEDRAAAEFAVRLARRDLREIHYLPELAETPRWPEAIWNDAEPNHERVLIRVETARDHVEWAVAVFHWSLVHWEHVEATIDGAVTTRLMDPDRHWRFKLDVPELVLRESGLTVIPPAAMRLHFGKFRLEELLDPRRTLLLDAARDLERVAESLLRTKGIRSRPQAYQRLLDFLRFGYDPAAIVGALEGRTPESWEQLVGWMEERNPPFAWTRSHE